MNSTEYDILMATDCRFPGGTTASVVEEIEAQYRAGYRTGLLHLSSPIQRSRRPFATRIRRVLEDGKAHLVGAQPVRTSVLLIRHPSVMSELPAGLAPIDAEHVVMIANQVPSDDRGAGAYFDPVQVHRNIRTVFGREAIWAPIGPRVRTALEPSGVPMLPDNWENIIDLDAWEVQRTGLVSDTPVIGRHSRGHWSKWPETRKDILGAYADDPRYRVRIMGGTEAPEGILGELPANWTTLPFDSIPVREFLAGIDFFVYFHHPGLVEAFGRVVLEALAAGAVCMVPPEMEPIFGDACHYGAPADVRAFVDSVAADPEEFLRRSRRGLDLVRERFSYQAHIERVTAIIGPPAGEPRRTESPQAGGPVSVLLDVGGTSPLGERTIAALSESFGPLVLLTDRAQDDWPPSAAVETVPGVLVNQPARDRDADMRRRLAHVVAVHEAARVLVLHSRDARYTGALDEAVQVELLRRRGPDQQWSATAVPGGKRSRPSPRAVAQRMSRQGMSLARRRAPRVVRRAGRTVADAGTRVRRGISGYAGVQNPTAVPVPAIYSHLDPRAPVVLLVVTSPAVTPERTLDAVLARAQVASAFRVAVLAPVGWVEAADVRGVTLETWVTEDQWPDAYTARWREYARDRLTHVARLIRPAAVVNIERTIDSGADPASLRTLDLMEAAARARQ